MEQMHTGRLRLTGLALGIIAMNVIVPIYLMVKYIKNRKERLAEEPIGATST